MAEKQKPTDTLAKIASRAMRDEKLTKAEIRKLGARVLDDRRNDPEPHKPTKKKK